MIFLERFPLCHLLYFLLEEAHKRLEYRPTEASRSHSFYILRPCFFTTVMQKGNTSFTGITFLFCQCKREEI